MTIRWVKMMQKAYSIVSQRRSLKELAFQSDSWVVPIFSLILLLLDIVATAAE